MSGAARTAIADAGAAFDPRTLRTVFGHFPSGLVTVAALGPDGPQGLLVATFTPVSIDPPLVSVNIGRASSTLPALRRQSHWGISVLSARQHDVADRFRLPADLRFAAIDWTSTPEGAVHVDGAVVALTVRPREFIEAGDHVIAVLALTDHRLATSPPTGAAAPPPPNEQPAVPAPLVFHRSSFRTLDEETVS